MLQGLTQSVDIDPVYGAMAIIAAATLLVVLLVRSIVSSHQKIDPLAGLFEADVLELEIEAAERRNANRPAHTAMLKGRIDHLSEVRALWGPDTRAEAIDQVAQVMRAGVRKGDAVTAEGPEGDGSFVIVAPGATEVEADRIAKRLLNTLSRTRVAGLGEDMRLSASFGVAVQKPGESDAEWHERARAALDAAQDSGEDQIIAASEWEEIALLPAPAPSADGEVEAA